MIDFETLQWSVERHETFEELMNYFLTDEFRESIHVETVCLLNRRNDYKNKK